MQSEHLLPRTVRSTVLGMGILQPYSMRSSYSSKNLVLQQEAKLWRTILALALTAQSTVSKSDLWYRRSYLEREALSAISSKYYFERGYEAQQFYVNWL